MSKHALITGIAGQDGCYLAEYLLGLGYRVSGVSRHGNGLYGSLCGAPWADQVVVYEGDICHLADMRRILEETSPDEIYNLASQSRPGLSWQSSGVTADVNGFAAQQLFDLVREIAPNARVFQASSSDMYGHAQVSPQDELTPFNPNNPYSLAKYYAHRVAEMYRAHYGQFIACGILYNHESPMRPLYFVPQKIAHAAACIGLGLMESPVADEQGKPIVAAGKVRLGNLDAVRDWGYAGDYVRAMHGLLQLDEAHSCVIGTGMLHQVRDLCVAAFGHVGADWQAHVVVDEQLMRRSETHAAMANPAKAKALLGWEARHSLNDLMAMMVDAQMEQMRQMPAARRA